MGLLPLILWFVNRNTLFKGEAGVRRQHSLNYSLQLPASNIRRVFLKPHTCLFPQSPTKTLNNAATFSFVTLKSTEILRHKRNLWLPAFF